MEFVHLYNFYVYDFQALEQEAMMVFFLKKQKGLGCGKIKLKYKDKAWNIRKFREPWAPKYLCSFILN